MSMQTMGYMLNYIKTTSGSATEQTTIYYLMNLYFTTVVPELKKSITSLASATSTVTSSVSTMTDALNTGATAVGSLRTSTLSAGDSLGSMADNLYDIFSQ